MKVGRKSRYNLITLQINNNRQNLPGYIWTKSELFPPVIGKQNGVCKIFMNWFHVTNQIDQNQSSELTIRGKPIDYKTKYRIKNLESKHSIKTRIQNFEKHLM